MSVTLSFGRIPAVNKVLESAVVGVGRSGAGETALAATSCARWAVEHALGAGLVDTGVQPDATVAMGRDPAERSVGRRFGDADACGDPLRAVGVGERVDTVVGREIARLAAGPCPAHNRTHRSPQHRQAVVAEFKDLAEEVNDHIADIERITRRQPG